MKRHVVKACCAVMLFVSGCKTVTTTEPIGSAAPLAELESLQGNWTNDDGETVEVRLARSGKLLIGGVEWDEDSEKFRAETIEVMATKCGELELLQFESDEESPNDGYVFCRYEIEGDQVRLYLPVMEVFQEAVASKELAGSIKVQQYSTNVRLDSTGKLLESFIAETGKNTCFEQEPAVTFERLKRVD